MRQFTNMLAAQRPTDVQALFQRFEGWRTANPGWQGWNEDQFRTTTGQFPGQAPPGGEGGEGGGEGGDGFGGPEAGGGVTPPQITGPTDWSGVLGIAGLPADLVAQITQIFSTVVDTSAAVAMALGVVRGSAWYAQTFPGITQGISHGLFQNEAGYRDYRNALDQIYRQWTSGGLTAEGLASALSEGVSPDIVGRRFEGRAFVETNRRDLAFVSGAFGTDTDLGDRDTAFTEAELQALGQQQAGLGTPGGLGMKVQRAAALAQERLNRAFEGVASSPQLALTTRGSLFSPSLQPGKNKPDIPA
jgi:hypothetical protein